MRYHAANMAAHAFDRVRPQWRAGDAGEIFGLAPMGTKVRKLHGFGMPWFRSSLLSDRLVHRRRENIGACLPLANGESAERSDTFTIAKRAQAAGVSSRPRLRCRPDRQRCTIQRDDVGRALSVRCKPCYRILSRNPCQRSISKERPHGSAMLSRRPWCGTGTRPKTSLFEWSRRTGAGQRLRRAGVARRPSHPQPFEPGGGTAGDRL
jgi:hypothetical protein